MFPNSAKWQREYRKRVSDGPWRARPSAKWHLAKWPLPKWHSANWHSASRQDTKFRGNIVVYFIIWTSFRLCTVKSHASAAVFVPKKDGKFCTSPEPKLPDQYSKRNRHLILIVDVNISNCGYQQYELSISTNCIVDIENSNFWYWTILMYCNVQYLMSVMDIICWHRQVELLISICCPICITVTSMTPRWLL